eukprot:GCRY01003677.1.p1 GENE.GCRY01003677.1~~GCRY01003677.1.p1  ORF type:complete len:432 (+),score=19.20 GCRY01003677.1:103-1296(+)
MDPTLKGLCHELVVNVEEPTIDHLSHLCKLISDHKMRPSLDLKNYEDLKNDLMEYFLDKEEPDFCSKCVLNNLGEHDDRVEAINILIRLINEEEDHNSSSFDTLNKAVCELLWAFMNTRKKWPLSYRVQSSFLHTVAQRPDLFGDNSEIANKRVLQILQYSNQNRDRQDRAQPGTPRRRYIMRDGEDSSSSRWRDSSDHSTSHRRDRDANSYVEETASRWRDLGEDSSSKHEREPSSRSRIPSSLSQDPSLWSVQDVGTWLTHNGLGSQLLSLFERNKINGQVLTALAEEDFKELGIEPSLFTRVSDCIRSISPETGDKPKIPSNYLCPVTLKLLRHPVCLLSDGHTYEEHFLKTWLQKHDTSPVTGRHLPNQKYVLNKTLLNEINQWVKKNGYKES